MKNLPSSASRLMLLPVLAAIAAGCAPQENAVAKEGGRPDPRAGALELVGTMSSSRAAHSATPLPDGRVLIAGGFTSQEYTAAGAEIYHPDAPTFVATGPMRTPRYGHTATLLPDGQVLLAGGWSAQGEYLATAELYHPATGTFAPTSPLTSSRAGHVAVPLQDGRVLLAGGVGTGRTFLPTAELFDPASGTFSLTGAMSVPRENHAAVRLADGRVLITGGHDGRGRDVTIHESAEVYDPATGTFASAGRMGIRRHKHDAVLLPDGRVLVTGGSDERDGDGAYASAELYDPAAGTFTPTGDMHLPRYKHHGTSVVLPSGRVLVGGGADRAEVYDPQAGTFSIVAGQARMAGQYSASVPLPSGGVLITGGYGNGHGPQPSAWLYRP